MTFPEQPVPSLAAPGTTGVHTDDTLTDADSGSTVLEGFGSKEISVLVNVTDAPTGTLPTLEYTIQEVDPGNKTTTFGPIATTGVISAAGLYTATLRATTAGTVLVSWTIGGTLPEFTGVYATVVSKVGLPTTAGGEIQVNISATSSGSVKITDGTYEAVVTAPSTAPLATDSALVVAISPNTSIDTTNPSVGLTDDPAPGSATQVGGSDGTNLQAFRVFDADTGGGTEYVLGIQLRKAASGGSVAFGTGTDPVRVDPTGTTTQPVSDAGGSLTVDTTQLPGALVGGRLDTNVGAWLGATSPTVGQKAMAASLPVVIASDQSTLPVEGTGVAGTPAGGVLTVQGDPAGEPIPITGSISATNPSVDLNDAPAPAYSTQIGGADSTGDLQAVRVYDADTGAGTEYVLGIIPLKPASGGAVLFGSDTDPFAVKGTTVDADLSQQGLLVSGHDGVNPHIIRTYPDGVLAVKVTDGSNILGTNANPIRVDPTGSTDQPVGVTGWLGSSAPTVGQKAMAASLPVVIASDQSAVAVSDGGGSITVDGTVSAEVTKWIGSTAPTVGQKAMAASVPVVIASDQTAVDTRAQLDSDRRIILDNDDITIDGESAVFRGFGAGTVRMVATWTGTKTSAPEIIFTISEIDPVDLTTPVLQESPPTSWVPTSAPESFTFQHNLRATDAIQLSWQITSGTLDSGVYISLVAVPDLSSEVNLGSESFPKAAMSLGGFVTEGGPTTFKIVKAWPGDSDLDPDNRDTALGVSLRKAASGGSVEAGTASDPLRVDPTGTTTQPVSDAGGSLTVDTTQLPSALVGGRLDTNTGAWLGSTAPTVGQKTAANSVPVVIASNQSTIATAPGSDKRTVLSNQTLTANGNSAIFSGFGSPNIALEVMIAGPVTPLSEITFFIDYVDPTDQTTVGGVITQTLLIQPAGGPDFLTPLYALLPGTDTVRVRWTVGGGGGSPSIGGVYASLMAIFGELSIKETPNLGLPPSFATQVGVQSRDEPFYTSGGGYQPLIGLNMNEDTFGEQEIALGVSLRVHGPVGSQPLGTADVPMRVDPTGDTTQPVSVASWIGSTAPTVGQKTSANSLPVVIASDQSAVTVSVASTGTVGSAVPASATTIGTSDGTNLRVPRSFDADTGGGTEYVLGTILRKSASGGSVEAGTSSDPLRIDPTGTTTQPVSVASWIGSTAPTVGQKTSANSLPVVIASDQSAVAVTAAQGTAAALSGYWPVRVTDGTNTMPTGDAVGRAIFEKITDGTNTAAVKAASTAAAASDPALVVSPSPNSVGPVGITTPSALASSYYATVYPAGFLRTSDEPHQLLYDPFEGITIDPNNWSPGLASGGGVGAAVASGSMTIGTGTTTNGYAYLQSVNSFRLPIPGWLGVSHALQFEASPTANTHRFWGQGTVPASPTASSKSVAGNSLVNGVGWELGTDGKLLAVVWSNGSRTIVEDLSAATGTGTQPTDGSFHRYIVYIRTDRMFWYIDSLDTPVASASFTSPQIQTLPDLFLAIAGTSPLSSGVITCAGVANWDTAKNNQTISDPTYPWRRATVAAASTAAVAADPALVVALSPNSNSVVVNGNLYGTDAISRLDGLMESLLIQHRITNSLLIQLVSSAGVRLSQQDLSAVIQSLGSERSN